MGGGRGGWAGALAGERGAVCSGGGASAGGSATPFREELLRVPDEASFVEQTLTMGRKLSLSLALTLSVDPPTELTLVERDTGVPLRGAKMKKFVELVHPVGLGGVPNEANGVELADAMEWKLVFTAISAHFGDPHAEVRVGDGHTTVAVETVVMQQVGVTMLPGGLVGVPHKAETVELGFSVEVELGLFVELALTNYPAAELAFCLGNVAVAVETLPLGEFCVTTLPEQSAVGISVHWRWSCVWEGEEGG